MKHIYSGLLAVIFGLLPVCAFSQETVRDTNDKIRVSDDFLEPDRKIEVKLNSLVLIGIVNPAFEFRVTPKFTVQTEMLASFYFTSCLGTGKPLVLGNLFVEGRYYAGEAFHGFFFGPLMGCGLYKINKGIYPLYKDDYPDDSYQQGQNLMLGISLGYQFLLSRRWSLELSLAGGYQCSVYQGYKRESPDEPYSEYVGVNYSAESIPYFKGGIYLGYRF